MEMPFTHSGLQWMTVGVLGRERLIFNHGLSTQALRRMPYARSLGVFAISVFPYEVILHFMSHPPFPVVYKSGQSVVFMDAGILPVLS